MVKKQKKKALSKADELLAGSMDMEILPDGRMVEKGKGESKKGKGVVLKPHTFYGPAVV